MFWKSYPRSRLLIRESDVSEMTINGPEDVMRIARTMIDDAGEGESVKDRLRKAAFYLGIDYGLAKRIRHNEIKEVKAHIFVRMTERYVAVLERLEKQSSEKTARYRARLELWGSQRESAAAHGASDPSLDR